jgi:hypothetical protein
MFQFLHCFEFLFPNSEYLLPKSGRCYFQNTWSLFQNTCKVLSILLVFIELVQKATRN